MGAGLVNVDVGGMFKGITDLASEFIEDKDKRNEFIMRVKENEHQLNVALITTKTHPTVDAIVKLMYAFLPFFRPVGTAAMTGFAIYARMKGIVLPPNVETILAGAFPAWGVSRHLEKSRK